MLAGLSKWGKLGKRTRESSRRALMVCLLEMQVLPRAAGDPLEPDLVILVIFA